jgi:hypothetical protein
MPFLSRQSRLRRGLFRTVSQVRVQYRDSFWSEGKAGKVCGEDRLPWIGAHGSDNFHPLKTLDWQVHVYGDVNETFRAGAAALGLTLAAFEWDREAGSAGLERDAFYLIRPDGYVALASVAQNTAVLLQFCETRGLRFQRDATAID